jgi:hypothetical protein
MEAGCNRGNGERSKRRIRHFAAISVAGVVGIAVLLVSSAAASAALTPRPSAPLTAPYTGTETAYAVVLLGGTNGPICGVAGSFPVSPFFNTTTGYANMSAKATSASCGPGTSDASAMAQAGFTSSPITGLSGLHHMKVNWVLDFSVKLSSTAPGTSTAEVYFYVETSAWIYDVNNGTTFFQQNYPEVNVGFTSGTYTHSYKVHQTDYNNATLVKKHSYLIEVFVTIGAFASVPPGSSTASALVNMGSNNKHGYLTSITGV